MPFGMDNFKYDYNHNGSIDSRYDNPSKKYVAVHALFNVDGSLVPESVEWVEANGDTKVFIIDEFVGVCRQASRKAGGAGWCFTVRIQGKVKRLFLEVDKWFVEIDN